jgi:hypothetical protein
LILRFRRVGRRHPELTASGFTTKKHSWRFFDHMRSATPLPMSAKCQ